MSDATETVVATDALSINNLVAVGIAASTPEVISGTIDALIRKETERRESILIRALNHHDVLSNTLASASKPDVKPNYNSNGDPIGVPCFSPAGKERLEKATKALANFNTLITNALDPKKLIGWDELSKELDRAYSKEPKDTKPTT